MSQHTSPSHAHAHAHAHTHLSARRKRIAILISAWSPRHAVCTILTWFGHWRSVLVRSVWSSSIGARRSYARRRVQRRAVVLEAVCAILAGMGILPLHVERRKLVGRLVHRGTATHRRGAVCFRQLINHQSILGQIFVIRGTAHVCVLLNALLASLATDQCPPHGACHYTGANDEDSSAQHDPASPLHMRNEKQDIDQEGEESDEESREGKDEEGEEVSRRMARAMEVSGHCKAEADQGEEGGDGVNDEDGRKAVPRVLGEAEVGIGVGAAEEAICVVSC